jgi:hypothetical protein
VKKMLWEFAISLGPTRMSRQICHFTQSYSFLLDFSVNKVDYAATQISHTSDVTTAAIVSTNKDDRVHST